MSLPLHILSWKTLRVGIPLLVIVALFAAIQFNSPSSQGESVSAIGQRTSEASLSWKRAGLEEPPPSPEEIAESTEVLTNWAANHSKETPLDPQIITEAQKRGRMMKSLIQQNPEGALQAMLPLESYLNLPEEIANLIESPFATAGTLDVVPDCSSDGGGPDFFGSWDERDLQVFVPEEREEMMSKDWISLSGIQVDGVAALHSDSIWRLREDEVAIAAELLELPLPKSEGAIALVGGQFVAATPDELEEFSAALRELENLPDPTLRPILSDGGETAEETAALLRGLDKASASWTLTDKKILFLNLQFADSSGPGVDKSEIEDRLAACGIRTEEMSYGKMRFTETMVSDALTLPGTEASYQSGDDILHSQMHDEALELAAAAGLISGSETSEWTDEYDIVGIVFPHQSVGWSGRASVGGRRHWINGDASFGTYIHEFGHNFGLQHASRWNETIASEIPPTPPTSDNLSTSSSVEPRHSEYGDWFDYMGGDGEFGVLEKNRLFWIDDEKIVDLTGDNMLDQTVRLYRFDESVADSKPTLGARVQMQNSETLWLNYRGNHAQSIASEGVHVIWQFTGSRGRLLDMTPENTTTRDTLLPLGRTYTDPTGLVNITPLTKGGIDGEEWLDVRVVTGVVGNTNPTLTASADLQAAAPLESIAFTAQGSDEDDDQLFYNWDFGDGRTETSSGASLSHAYLVGGSYTVKVSVLDGRGGIDETAIEITVADPLLQLTEVESGTSSTIYEVIYHQGRYLAITSNQLLLSFDGLTWEDMPTPSPVGPHYGIEATDVGLILVGTEYLDGALRGQIWESEDGFSWTTHDTPVGTGSLRSVCEGNGIRVAVGDNGTLMRKLAGGSWETIPLNETLSFKKVTHDGTRFWAVGSDNLILTSTHSNTWTTPLTETDGYSWSDYETGLSVGNLFFAGGDYGRMGVTSDGGDSWTESLDTTTHLSALTSIPSRVVCFGNDYDDDAGRTQANALFVTTDGSTWAEAVMATPFQVSGATYGADRLIVVGSGGVIQASASFLTDNETPAGSLSLPSAVNARADFSPTGAVSDADGDPLNYYWNLGEGWFEQGSSPNFNFTIGGSQTIELAVVDSRGGVLRQSFSIEVADPLLSFTAIETGGEEDYTDLICVNGQTLAISWGALHSANTGETLTETSSINPFYPYDLASDGSTVVYVGQTYDNEDFRWVGGISSSSVLDPVPFTSQTIPFDSRYLKGVAYGNNIWVAVGDEGRLLSKVGSGDWAERSSGVTVDLNEIAYGDNVFMAVGDSGTIIVSSDGINWALKPSPTTSGISKVNYCGSGFCLGGSGALHFSADGGETWSTTDSINFIYISAIWTGDVIVVLGDLYDLDLRAWVPHFFVSEDGVTWQTTVVESLDNVRDLVHCQDSLLAVGSDGAFLSANLAIPTLLESLVVTLMKADPATGVRLSISSQPGDTFDIYRASNLVELAVGVPFASDVSASAVGNFTEWTDSSPLSNRAFYRVEKQAN
ncbi:PKD domain-containing protein [Akkermansiaceae bacterium]|nr:PKD domain-containing protein [Akkermansiaceae bacterium]